MKNFILDTNVILNDPKCIFRFQDNNIYIPLIVIEEIDKFKQSHNELSKAAREFSRILDSLSGLGSFQEGIQLVTKISKKKLGKLFIIIDQPLDNRFCDTPDNIIISCALEIKNIFKKHPTILVSNDTNVRLKAKAFGLQAEEFYADDISADILYSGIIEYQYNENQLPITYKDLQIKPFPNQFVKINDNDIFIAKNNELKPIKKYKNVQGIDPLNEEQNLLLNLLFDKDIDMVSVIGSAGSGKTIMSLVTGLQQVEQGVYNKIIILRSQTPMGGKVEELGTVPGDKNAKLDPLLGSTKDTINFIMSNNPTFKKEGYKRSKTKFDEANKDAFTELKEQGLIEIESIAIIRGRSIRNAFIIIEEAQNLSINTIQSIITRAGEGTKIVILGDLSQIDSPYLDSENNGLSYVIEKYKSLQLTASIKLNHSVRSRLVEELLNTKGIK